MDLRRIRELALSPAAQLPLGARESHAILAGERPAPFAGGGIEFAEHRAFQPGDSPRFINWRLYGRSGQLFVRRFQEERREQLFLLIDQRAPMWFGTRRRLKVARALAQAVFLAQVAERRQMEIGAVVLSDHLDWHAPRRRFAALAPLFAQLNRQADPAGLSRHELALNAILPQLALRIPRGSTVCLISDFHDLDADSVALLYALARHHSLTAFHVQDPIELQLPPQGRYTVADAARPEVTRVIDCDDAARRGQWQARLDERNARLRDWLVQGGAVRHACLTTDDWQDLLRPGRSDA